MTNKAEKIVPYNSSEKKAVQVERMFDEIADNYDTLNRTLSMGIDKAWRKNAILSLASISPKTVLDVATGTGDLAIEALERLHSDRVLGIDISEKMMEIGRQKVMQLGLSDRISFEKRDCMDLQLNDNCFDAAMVAFGVRNFENLDKGLQEILRVLKPGGKLMILELSTPEHFPMKQAYRVYSRLIIPLLGRLISKSKEAYRYLPKSIAAFPQGEEMIGILKKNGFNEIDYKTFTMGICSMYIGKKK